MMLANFAIGFIIGALLVAPMFNRWNDGHRDLRFWRAFPWRR